jgi:hypothetical protein
MRSLQLMYAAPLLIAAMALMTNSAGAQSDSSQPSAASLLVEPEVVLHVGESVLQPQFVDRCLEIAQEIDSGLAKQLTSLCQDDPEDLERLIRRTYRRLTALAELKASDPGLFAIKLDELKIDAEIMTLTHDLCEAAAESDGKGPQVQVLRSRLEGVVRVRQALALKARKAYIERLQEHITAMKAKLSEDTKVFDQLVSRQITEILTTCGINAAAP